MTLASLFAPRAVLFRGLAGTQTASFSGLIPALTIECGQSGEDANAEAAARLILAVLTLENLESSPHTQELNLFHTLARVRVRGDVALGRDRDEPWLELQEDLDLNNFQRLNIGFRFGRTNHAMPVEAIDEDGKDVARAFFRVHDQHLTLKKSAVPAMLTAQNRIIRQDCLCYLMEEWR